MGARRVLVVLGVVLGVLASWLIVAGGAQAAECSNELLRSEQPYGLELPDCRAYEMVSPLEKNDNDALEFEGPYFNRAAVSGEAITYNALGSYAEPKGSQFENQFLSRRGPDGWSTRDITPPYQAFQTNVFDPYQSLTFTPELSRGVTITDFPLASEATIGYENIYLSEFAKGSLESSYQLLTNSTYVKFEGEPYSLRQNPVVENASTDLSHVVFKMGGLETYEWTNGKAYEVGIGPNGEKLIVLEGTYYNASSSFWRRVSEDGLRVSLSGYPEGGPGVEQVYVRENPEQPQSPLDAEGKCAVPVDACTVEVSASQKSNGSGPGGTDPNGASEVAEYQDASVDGSRVFFTSRAELTNDANTGPEDNAANLYEYNMEERRLADLTVDTNVGDVDGAGVLGVVGASEDGSYVYFLAEGELAAGSVSGARNLYLYHDGKIVLVAVLNSTDGPSVVGGSASITPDGTHLAFLSTKSLTGYDNEQAAPGDCEGFTKYSSVETGECNEIYEYDADASGDPLTCASCNPSGARPVGPSSLGVVQLTTPVGRSDYVPRNLSEDGDRLFFESEDALVPHDSNGLGDVYEYEDGHVYPISNVAGGGESIFLDASANGDDVFIATTDQLVPSDTDFRVDVYDARVGGGFPVSVTPPGCDNADSCKGPVSPQPAVFGAPASATFAGAGNITSAPSVTVVKAKHKPKPNKKKKKHRKKVKTKGKATKRSHGSGRDVGLAGRSGRTGR